MLMIMLSERHRELAPFTNRLLQVGCCKGWCRWSNTREVHDLVGAGK